MRKALTVAWREFEGFTRSLTVSDGWVIGVALVISMIPGTSTLTAVVLTMLLSWPVVRWIFFDRTKALARERWIRVLIDGDSTLEEIDQALGELNKEHSKSWSDIGVEVELKKRRNKMAPMGFR